MLSGVNYTLSSQQHLPPEMIKKRTRPQPRIREASPEPEAVPELAEDLTGQEDEEEVNLPSVSSSVQFYFLSYAQASY